MTGPGQRHEESNVNRAHYTSKTELTTRLFTVLDWSIEDRALHLISQISRAVRRGDVLEIICTDEKSPKPGAQVNRVAYIGYVEVSETGLLLCGDTISVQQEEIGKISGFDETPLPNHLHVIMQGDSNRTGYEMGLSLDDLITFSGISMNTDRDLGF